MLRVIIIGSLNTRLSNGSARLRGRLPEGHAPQSHPSMVAKKSIPVYRQRFGLVEHRELIYNACVEMLFFWPEPSIVPALIIYRERVMHARDSYSRVW